MRARTYIGDLAYYASFHMQKRMSRQSWSTVMPCTGRIGSDGVEDTVAGCVAAFGKSWETEQVTSRHARALEEVKHTARKAEGAAMRRD